MKIFKNNQRVLYILSCILVAFFLYGCKEKELGVSVFDGLPESPFLTEIKTSLDNHIPLAIAFTAEWCPHCRHYKPVFNEVKDLYHDKVAFINIDVDDANGSPISSRFQVRGIPTTGFVRADGSVYKVQVGEVSKNDLIKIADELILNKKRKKGEPVAPFPIDIKKEEAAPQKEEGTKLEENKPAEESPAAPSQENPAEEAPVVTPPEEPPVEESLPPIPPLDEPSNETIQLPEPNEQDDSLDSEDASNKNDSLPEDGAVPEQ